MIRRLCLRNWRSYQDLDISLEPGTTFVVAPNGVGKTSLVYGLAWAVFGKHCAVEPKACIRSGSDCTEAQVEFELPSENRLSITRSIKRLGKPTASYELDGEKVSEATAQEVMELAFGMELGVASRVSMMLGGGHVSASKSLDLESHLHSTFGVSDLLNAADTAELLAKEAKRDRTAIRTTVAKQSVDRAALELAIEELEQEFSRCRMRSIDLLNARDFAATQLSIVERHDALAEQIKRFEHQRSLLVSSIERALGLPLIANGNDAVQVQVTSALESNDRSITELTRRVASSQAIAASAQNAIAMLGGGQATCPTCLRPLPHIDRNASISAHELQLQEARRQASNLEETLSAKQERTKALSQLLAQYKVLVPPAPDTKDPDAPTRAEAQDNYERATSSLDSHNQLLGRIQSQLDALEAQKVSDDQTREEERQMRLAYRREAAAIAGSMALRSAADRLIESRIEPIASEVRTRWKHLFPSNGLAFRPDGSITRFHDGQELDWDTLSGGERTWARIVTHLIVMATTTSLPFAWFDEPLEHLDPQLRFAVAATLARATRLGTQRQLLVTTYEHGIAQRLADDTEGVEIIAIRDSGPQLSTANAQIQ